MNKTKFVLTQYFEISLQNLVEIIYSFLKCTGGYFSIFGIGRFIINQM